MGPGPESSATREVAGRGSRGGFGGGELVALVGDRERQRATARRRASARGSGHPLPSLRLPDRDTPRKDTRFARLREQPDGVFKNLEELELRQIVGSEPT